MNLPVLWYAAIGTSFAPPVAGTIRYHRLDRTMKLFLGYCAIICSENAAETILAFHHISNLFLATIFLALEPVLLCVVYASGLEKGAARRFILLLTLLSVVFCLPDLIVYDVTSKLNEGVAIVSRIVVIAMSAIVLHNVARGTTRVLTEEPFFWVATANVLGGAGAIFVLGAGNELLAMGVKYFVAAWNLNWALNTAVYLLFLRSYFCRTRGAMSIGQ